MAEIEGCWVNICSSQEPKHDGAIDGKKDLKQAEEQNLPTKGGCKCNSFFFGFFFQAVKQQDKPVNNIL